MVQIGRTNRLQIVRWTPQGPYLGADHGDILLPEKYAPEDADVGDWVEVFIYLDSEERLIATTQTPLAEVDQFAALRVIKAMEIGAFLDWGLDKDLLVPLREQGKALEEGDIAVVRICLEEGRNRLYATNKLNQFLSFEEVPYRRGQQVQLLISNHTGLGAYAVVDQTYSGFIYRSSEEQELPEIGARVPGYIVKVRDDGKIDLTLKPMGITGLLEARKKILAALEAGGGRLNLTDDSDPETIKARLAISKKQFKRALGILKKEDMIFLEESGIAVNPNPQPRSKRRDDEHDDGEHPHRRTPGNQRKAFSANRGRPVGKGPRRRDERDERGGERHRRDGEGYRRDGERHRRDGEAHRRDGERHRRDGERHRRDGEGHRRDGEGHRRDGEAHRRDGERHRRDGEAHRRDGERHRRDGEARRHDSGARGRGRYEGGTTGRDTDSRPRGRYDQNREYSRHRDEQDSERGRRSDEKQQPRGNKSRDHRKGTAKKKTPTAAAPIFKKAVDDNHPFARFANAPGGQSSPKKKKTARPKPKPKKD
ncbi:S1-like domain-containing RNA-binding protein [Acanthopleuribacter pedis]|uniref:S1 motif domain-containing protein n=1 Tax=Acanthopleuribacter pedis TaxID=442870 RepID=A0A8J7QEQ8_9BACT|nr:S1-like domain-containing RNA-binding protein [Acanthopleuribacter pedis]MBO1323292.1 hypothetical protein [Acanthopleuribacter pedis]